MEKGYTAIESAFAVGMLGLTITSSIQAYEFANRMHNREVETLLALHLAENAIEAYRTAKKNNFTDTKMSLHDQFTQYVTWKTAGDGHQVCVSVEWSKYNEPQRVQIESYIP